MRQRPLVSPFIAWLALLASLLGALTPAISQAVVAGGERAGWVQVCSVTGVAWVQHGDADPGAPEDNKGAVGCAWCAGHGAAALPPAPSPWRPVEAAAAFAERSPVSAELRRPWAHALSRAPPLGA